MNICQGDVIGKHIYLKNRFLWVRLPPLVPNIMHKHHVIPRHEWKIRFGNLKGFNSFDNVVWLTIEQHAEAHKLLYELNSSHFDLCAYKILSALSRGDTEEVRRISATEVNRGNQYAKGKRHIRSEEYRNKMSESMRGNCGLIGNKNASGKHKKTILTQEHKEKIRQSLLIHHKVKLEEIRGIIEQHGG